MRWRWSGGESQEFESQDAAEAWLAEHWQAIEADAVELVDGDEVLYEMSLLEQT